MRPRDRKKQLIEQANKGLLGENWSKGSNVIKDINQLKPLLDKSVNISAGGARNLGVFDLGNGYVVKKWKGATDSNPSILKYSPKVKSSRIILPIQMIMYDGSLYEVQKKATGKPFSHLSKSTLEQISEEHKQNFINDINELSSLNLSPDPSKLNNFYYDPGVGIILIDLSESSYLSSRGENYAKSQGYSGVGEYLLNLLLGASDSRQHVSKQKKTKTKTTQEPTNITLDLN